ncbi:salivary glue protein Sgs-3, putative, partial [Ixodes scapularis]
IRAWNKLRRHRYPRPPPLIIRHPPHKPPLIKPIATRLPNTEIPTSNVSPIEAGVTLHEHATTNPSTPGSQGTHPVLPVGSPTTVPPGTEPIIGNLTSPEIPVTSSTPTQLATLTSPMTGLSQEIITESQVTALTTTKMTTLENDESSISTNTASQASQQPTTGLTPGPSTTFESHENDDVTTGPLSTATAISALHSVTMIGDPVTQTAKEQVATEEPAEVPTTLLLTSTGPTIQTAVTQDPQITEVQATGPTSSQPLATEAPITAAESTEESTPQIPT